MTSNEESVMISVKRREEWGCGGVRRGWGGEGVGVRLPRYRILPQIKGPLQ